MKRPAETRRSPQTPPRLPSKPAAFEPVADGVRVRVRLTPKAARDAIDGVEALSDGSTVLVARVRAVPEKGEANAALALLLAAAAGVARTKASVVSGSTSRIKILHIAGAPDAIMAALERQIAPQA